MKQDVLRGWRCMDDKLGCVSDIYLLTANWQEHGSMDCGLPLFPQSYKPPPRHGEKPAGSRKRLRGVLSSDCVRAEVTFLSASRVWGEGNTLSLCPPHRK